MSTSKVTIATADGTTTVRAPFHPDWPSRAHALGGKRPNGAWVFDSRDEERVRALAREIFGTDGTPDPGGTVSVRIQVSNVEGAKGGKPAALYEYGRLIATRFDRDAEPRLGAGVVLISGGFAGRAGSHNYLELGPLDDTVVELRDIPRSVADENGLEIVGEGRIDHDALRAERELLTARISEIDAILVDRVSASPE
ncbi:hypothetical protein ABZ804_22405 [Streptomyces sp. NPDC047726]|uniref:hypothetical protein n=1 Tax=unclassified Streptomyces TaxID=2593676 RepID=UPI0033D1095B